MNRRIDMLGEYIEKVKEKRPLIHNITNYVTANDLANVILACGASPIMADAPEEAEDIGLICSGLNINLGTLNNEKQKAMLVAGRKANEMSKPVVLDPVGAGSIRRRTETARMLLSELRISALRCNISEFKALAFGKRANGGVDASIYDELSEDKQEEILEQIMQYSRDKKIISAVTGAADIVTDGRKAYIIRNGIRQMRYVTGIGCQLSGLLAAFIASDTEHMLEAAASAVCLMGRAGEIAWENMKDNDGNATYRNRIIDAVYNMDKNLLERGAKVQIYEKP